MSGALGKIALRPVVAGDAAPLCDLWRRVFGDPADLMDAFFRLLPEMGCGVLAERDGEVLGAAYLIDGFSLHAPGTESLKCGYLYAVAVAEHARRLGIGAALSREAVRLGKARGAQLICTLPAEPSLYSWYGKILQLREQSRRTVFVTSALPEADMLAPEDYGEVRENMLANTPHAVPNQAAMEFQWQLCRAYGGGFYRSGDLLFCAYRDAGIWRVPELLFPSGGAPVPRGFQPLDEPYLCADLPFPEDFVWNLTFD